jgi:uncharacterized protein (DUF58 family)
MTIAAHRKVRNALEGEYASVFKGRSMDFDDLRPYVPSDDVKDIDWKATARSGQVLIKRYVAIRKYNIMLVVDTGRSMAATAPSGESKRDIAVMTAGVIASIAQKHGDPVGLTAGDSDHIKHLPLKESRPHVERMLQYINNNTTLDAPASDLLHVLDYVRRTIKRRMMLIVISDNLQFAHTQQDLLKRMAAQHELMFIAIDDVDPDDVNWSGKALYDVDQPSVLLPQYIRSQRTIEEAYQAHIKSQWKTTRGALQKLRISNVRIKSEAEVIPQLVRLLEEHKHARRR